MAKSETIQRPEKGTELFDTAEKVFPDVQAEPGETAYTFMHTVPYEGSVGLVNLLTTTRVLRKGFKTHLILYGPGVLMASGSRGFPKPGRALHPGYKDGLTPLAISPRQRLDDAVRTVSNLPFGGTDCALPMLYAQATERAVDTFVIYTDSETWAGDIHPVDALRDYRRASGIDARLVVVGMVSNGFSIADPADPGMLDVVGFDTATPQLISDFARGDV